MKKIKTKRKFTPFFIAFLVAALVFLAVGMGTLGSFRTTGDDFELKAPVTKEDGTSQTPTVVFRLDSSVTETYTDEEGKEQTRSISLAMDEVYLFVSAIYSEAGTPASVSVRRSSSADPEFFGGTTTASLENLYTAEPAAEETAESDKKDAVQTDALYRWVHPFEFQTKWGISTYRYWELSAVSAGMRISEVLFVGRPTSGTAEHSAERYIIPATVYSATPDTGETAEQARAAAEALLDAQPETIPSDPVSSYDEFTKAEIYSLLTVTEMKVGNSYSTANDRVMNVYHVEGVYNVLGMDLIALGTKMFGMSPFGLRFMPMLFSFGIMVLGFFFVRQLFNSDRAGFMFSVLYALCDLSFSLGHVGTPLTAGLFFLLLSAFLVDRFYRKGLKKGGLAALLFGGLSAAAAICVNGAMLIPVLAVCGLYVAGMIRQQKVNNIYLGRAVEAQAASEDPEGNGKISRVLADNRYRNLVAGTAFPAALILGTILFSLLFLLPVYYPLIKFYDDPSAPTMNLFSVGWKAFLGGFVGKNVVGGMPSAWDPFYRIFVGTGEVRALTAAVINPIAALVGLFGLGYAIFKVVTIAKNFSVEGKELRRIAVPLAGLVVSLISAAFGGGALGFIFLAYIFAFMLAAYAAEDCMNLYGTAGKAAKIVSITALVLLAAVFMLLAILTFSVPVSAGFLGNLV